MKSKSLQIMLSVTALLLACLALIAAAVVQTGEAVGTVTVEICRKTAEGKWEVIDRAKAPIQCALSYAGAAANATVASSAGWRWTATSEKGRQFTATIPRPGKARFEAATGLLEIELPIEVIVDGKRETLPYKQTTESLTTVLGTLSGKRANVNADGFTAATVGLGILRNRELIDHLCSDAQVKDKKKAKREVNELIVVLRSEGRATLKK